MGTILQNNFRKNSRISMKAVYLRTDGHGYNYIIPEEKVKDFDFIINLISDDPFNSPMYYKHLEVFENLYGQHRQGSIDNIKFYIDD